MKKKIWPLTFDEAVKRVIATLTEADKVEILKFPKKDLVLLHMSMGMKIRNDFGLHQGNDALMRACGTMDADAVSTDIVEAVWKRLKAELGRSI